MVKNLPANTGDAGDMSSIPGLGRSPEGGNNNSFQYSCLDNSPLGLKELDTTINAYFELKFRFLLFF